MLPLAFLAQLVAQVPVPEDQSDIQVVSRRLAKLRLDVGLAQGQITGCRVTVTSGDKIIDGLACNAAYRCVRSGVTPRDHLLSCINNKIAAVVLRGDTTLPKG